MLLEEEDRKERKKEEKEGNSDNDDTDNMSHGQLDAQGRKNFAFLRLLC